MNNAAWDTLEYRKELAKKMFQESLREAVIIVFGSIALTTAIGGGLAVIIHWLQ